MYISKLIINGFRGFKHTEIEFEEGLNVIIGHNNLLSQKHICMFPISSFADYIIMFQIFSAKHNKFSFGLLFLQINSI